jgi:hypothetical protein
MKDNYNSGGRAMNITNSAKVQRIIRSHIKDEMIATSYIATEIYEAIFNHAIHEFACNDLIQELIHRETHLPVKYSNNTTKRNNPNER